MTQHEQQPLDNSPNLKKALNVDFDSYRKLIDLSDGLMR